MRRKTIALAVVALLLIVPVAGGIEVTSGTFIEGFEDYSQGQLTGFNDSSYIDDVLPGYVLQTQGIDGGDNMEVAIVSDSVEGSNAIYLRQDIAVDTRVYYNESVVTNPKEGNVTFEFSFKHKIGANGGHIGITDGTFNESGSKIYLRAENPAGGGAESVQLRAPGGSDPQSGALYDPNTWQDYRIVVDFDNENVHLYSVGGGSDTLELSTSFTASSFDGEFLYPFVETGGGTTANREVWADDLSLIAGDVSSQELIPDAETYMKPGTTQEYAATFNTTYTNGTIQTESVTDEVNVTSQNATLLTVDEANNELTTTSDANLSGTVNVTFEFEGVEENVSIFVGQPTMDNFELLPSTWRISALFNGDNADRQPGGFSTFPIILVMVIGGIVGSRMASAWGGLGAMVLVLIAGWFAGYVGTFLLLAGLAYAAFVGLNLTQVGIAGGFR